MTPINRTVGLSNCLLTRAIAYVRTGKGLDDQIQRVEGLDLPRSGEDSELGTQVQHIVSMLRRYRDDKEAKRPLSIVVFGPPGSGKSTFVEKITDAVTGYKLMETANLTQIAGTTLLATLMEKELRQLANTRASADATPTPVFFFDEFDAALDGAPLGWLSWFLAPMQDGVVLAPGGAWKVGKAVFIFAGGTAETLDIFNLRAEEQDPEAYRARKVPDFVSRLRGAIEIGGVNAAGDARIVPRALVLHRLLEKRLDKLDDGRVRELLSYGHFVHGVRSMITVLEAGWSENGEVALPETIRRQHFSRGKLDGQTVGISAGLTEAGSPEMFSALTRQLLHDGATLAYGGAFFPKGTLEQVKDAARDVPPEPSWATESPPRVRHYLGYPALLQAEDEDVNASSKLLEFIPLNTLSKNELQAFKAPDKKWFSALALKDGEAYNPDHHVAWALSLFRMRVRMIQDVSALVVLGGKDDGLSWGRIAGIAEEVMIALALHKPVFVMGGAGGAAQAVGQLLGLDGTLVGFQQCLAPSAFAALAEALARHAAIFEIPGVPNSPRDLCDVRRFLFRHGVTTAHWPWNGLSQIENRELFACPLAGDGTLVEQAVRLIVRGLSRIDWKPVRAPGTARRS